VPFAAVVTSDTRPEERSLRRVRMQSVTIWTRTNTETKERKHDYSIMIVLLERFVEFIITWFGLGFQCRAPCI